MPRFEVYGFNKIKGFFGTECSPIGWMKEVFDNEADARAYCSVMSKKDGDKVDYRIKRIEEGWLTY